MQKNPHIRSLSLQLAYPRVLKLVAQNLPELESLSLEHYYETSETQGNIRFEKVKSFSMQQSSFSAPNNVTFNELTELRIDGLPKYCRRWFQFIEKHPNLQRVEVVKRDLSASDVMRLANSRFNVSEISFHYGDDVDGDDIAYLIKQTNLQSIILKESISHKANCHDCHSANNYFQDDKISLKSIKNTLRQSFGDKWNARENNSEIIIEKNKDKYYLD